MKYHSSQPTTTSGNPPDATLERIARLAARLSNAPLAVISQGDGENQSVRAAFGLEMQQAQNAAPFCAHAAAAQEISVAADVQQDARFSKNPLVADQPGVRFFAGAPLVDANGRSIGALIVLDDSPREFGDAEYSALADLASLAADEIELQQKIAEQREFRTMLKNAPDIIARIDRQMRYVFISPAVERLFGLIPSELQGKNFHDVGLPEGMATFWEERIQQVFDSGQEATVPFTFPIPSGSTLYLETKVIPEFGPDGNVQTILSVTRDVTTRKRAELELEKQQMRLQNIFDHIPVMIDFYDSNSQFHLVNHEWERVTGWTMEEIAEHPDIMGEFYPDPEYRRLALEQMQHGGGQWMEAKTCVRDGRIINTAWKNVPLPDGTNLGIGQDITERKKAEEEQAHLVAILEATPDFVAIADATGHVVYVNRAGRQMLGIEPDEDTSGSMIADYYPLENSVTVNEGLPAAIRDGIWSGESALRKRNGEEIPVSQVVIAHRSSQGEIEFYSTIARDITQRKQAEEALLAAKKEAERANEAKSEFLSRMSHELRTPLNAILGFGQLFDKESLTPRNTENVEQIVKAGQHLLALINEVLDIASIDAGRLTLSLEAISVQEVVEEVLALMRPLAAERRIQFENLIADEYYVRADRQRFKQIVLNLVSNAVKYNREGGTVGFSVQESDQSLRLKVTDTGEGIAPADMEKMFSPFERLDADKRGIKGSGIGLVLSKRLAEVMGGTIGVQSTLDEGSTFWVSLPRDESPLKRLTGAKQQSSVLRALAEPKCCLVYIEDNLPNLKLVEHILKHRPEFRLMAATRGDLGLELIREHRPDLILLDLHLPGMSGDEVLRRLQADPRTKDIPVVIISADTSSRQIHRLLSAGVKHYLTKPFNVKQLLQIVDDLVQNEDTPDETRPLS